MFLRQIFRNKHLKINSILNQFSLIFSLLKNSNVMETYLVWGSLTFERLSSTVTVSAFPNLQERAESCTTAADCANDTCHDQQGNVVCAIHHGDTGVCHCEHHHHHTPHPHPAVRNDKCYNDTDCSPTTCHGQDGIITCETHHEGHAGICHCARE